MTALLRHRCRNPRCGCKLPEPTENTRAAFCAKSCWQQYHRRRCVVCEGEFDRTSERQQWLCGRRKCKATYRRFPAVYRPFDLGALAKQPTLPELFSEGSETSIKRALKTASRSLRGWGWVRCVGDDDDWDLIGHDGKLLARIRQEGSQYWVARPRAIPEPPLESLEQAQHRAESMTLAVIPLSRSKLAARIAKDNSTPNPKGLPLDRSLDTDMAKLAVQDASTP